MELKLSEGRYVSSDKGLLESVSGREERLQRIMCRLAARRGAFLPMPDFGSRLHSLTSLKPSAREAAARQAVHEALAEEEGVEIISVKCADGEGETLRIEVELALDGKEVELALTV